DALRHASNARGRGQHDERGEEWCAAAGNVEAAAGDGPPQAATAHAGLDFDLLRLRFDGFVVARDVVDCEVERVEVFAREFGARGIDRAGGERERLRRALVDGLGPALHGRLAFALHVVEDTTHDVRDFVVAATRGTRERGLPLDGGEFAPIKAFHRHIIFSMGRTRMAEAPAALSSSSVSQNTDSWQTACTATISSEPA